MNDQLPPPLPPPKKTGINKWKVISTISIVIIVILSSGLFYYYTDYNQVRDNYGVLAQQYDSLHNQYNQLSNDYNALQNQYNQLKSNYDINQLLAANKRLEDKLYYLQQEGLINQTYGSFMFRYNGDMVKFVNNITQGDVESDLYQIHSKWLGMFHENYSYDSEELVQRVQGYIEHGNLSTGQPYATDAQIFINKEYVSTGPSIFKEKRGLDIHFARSLAALYYCYFDIVKKPYSVYVLDILIGQNDLHQCVLIKDNHGKVAIMDWHVITESDGKVSFMPVRDAVKLHEVFWVGQKINYNWAYSRYGPDIGWAWDQDAFYAWAQGSG